jgi:hypothetical protein
MPSGVLSLMLGGLTASSETCKVVATIDSVAFAAACSHLNNC